MVQFLEKTFELQISQLKVNVENGFKAIPATYQLYKADKWNTFQIDLK